jgi:hypothetical protein
VSEQLKIPEMYFGKQREDWVNEHPDEWKTLAETSTMRVVWHKETGWILCLGKEGINERRSNRAG